MVAKSWFVAIEAGLQRAIVADALRSSESLLKRRAGAVARRQRQRAGGGGSARQRRHLSRHAAPGRAGARAGVARARTPRSDAIRRRRSRSREQPVADAAAGAGRRAVGVARAPAGRVAAERRVAAAFNRVGEAKAAQLAAHQPDRRRQQRVERRCSCCRTRAIRSGASAPTCLRRFTRAARCGRRSRSAPPSRSRRSRTTRAPRSARSAKSRMRWPPRTRCAIATPFSSANITRQRARARTRADPVSRRQRRPARRRAEPARAVLGAHLAAARADRAAGAARQPLPRAGRRLRPAGDGAGGGAVTQGRNTLR